MEFPKRILEHWPDSGDGMEFKLVFKGTLPSERRAGVEIKHNVRRVLHPQLRTLWQQDPALRGAFDPKLNMRTKGQLSRVEELATDNAKYGFRFVPLVKKND